MDPLEQAIEELKKELGEDVITTGSTTPRPEKAIIREAFDDFNERNPLAGGGMLVQPSTDGSRPGYAKKEIRTDKGEESLRLYDEFMKLTDNKGSDAQFEEYKKLKSKRKGPPSVLAKSDKINEYLSKLIPKLNAEEKFYTKEDVSSMVEKKFKIKPRYATIYYKGKPSKNKVNQFGARTYPVMNTLDSAETKLDNAIKNMLIEDKPLGDFFYQAIMKRTGLDRRVIAKLLPQNQTYQVLKDQGGYTLVQRFNKENKHGFLKNLSLSDQLKAALELELGTPRFTGVEDITGQSKKGGVYGKKGFTYSPKFRVMEFAKRNWNRNKGEGVVKFVDQKGNPIKWQLGLELPFNKVGFEYNGKIYKANDLTPELMKKDFPEVYNNQLAINRLNTQVIPDPINKGKTITVGELVKRTQVNNYQWSPKLGSFDIMHGSKGVAGEPFTNLTYNTRDINQIEMGVNKLVERGVIKRKDGISITNAINDLSGSGNPELIKQRAIRLAEQSVTGKPLDYQTVKNNFFKALTNKKYGRIADVLVKAGKDGGLGNVMQVYCAKKKAKGGRIFLSEGSGCPAARQDPEQFLKDISKDKNVARFFNSTAGKKAATAAARVGLNVINPSTLIGGEVAYVLADGLNNFSKGMDLAESFDRAFIFADFKQFDEAIMNKAKELKFDDNQLKVLQETMNINRLDNEIGKLDAQDRIAEADTSLMTPFANTQVRDRLNKQLDQSADNYLSTLRGMGFKFDNVSDYDTGFNYLDNVFKKKTQDELVKTYQARARQVDPTSGKLGNVFDPLFDLGAYTQPFKYAADIVNPFTKNVPFKSERQREADRLREMEGRELYLYNKQRGFDLDSITDGTSPYISEVMQQLGGAPTGEGMFASFAGGGIAGLSGGIDEGPQRISMNPDSQGLSGLLKNGKKI